MTSPIRSIVHPTDFSDLSGAAFAHALGIALAAKSRLHLLHVDQHDQGALAFPHVRQLLVQWGKARADDPPWVVAEAVGIEVDNIRLAGQDLIGGIIGFLHERPIDLVVLATQGRDGIDHLLKGSVSETVFRRSAIPTLFIARGARGFVDQINGDVALRRVLVPVDFSPEPARAIATVQRLARLIAGGPIELHLLHVGRSAPASMPAPQICRHCPR